MDDLIDPTATGNYPVILGDGLLGKASNEIFTGIRYNHKPTLSSNAAPDVARLKPSIRGQTGLYDLSFDDGGKYTFEGTRNTNDNQYVLHFDPERKAFILDKIDSTFNMNITRLPNNTTPESLSRRYPHLDTGAGANPSTSKEDKETARPAAKPRAKSPSHKKEAPRRTEKKQPKRPSGAPAGPAMPRSEPRKGPDDAEEEEDDDGGLLVEYPGANPKTKGTDFSPAFPSVRRFDEFMDRRESEAEDADGESDDEPDMEFKLPSPVNNRAVQPEPRPAASQEAGNGGEDAGGVADDLEDDLEKEMEKDMEMALNDLENSQQGSPNGGNVDESEISEED